MANKPDHPRTALPLRAVLGLALMVGASLAYAAMNSPSVDVVMLMKLLAAVVCCILAFRYRNALRRIVTKPFTHSFVGGDSGFRKSNHVASTAKGGAKRADEKPANLSQKPKSSDFDPSLFIGGKPARKGDRTKKIEALRNHSETPEQERLAAERMLNKPMK